MRLAFAVVALSFPFAAGCSRTVDKADCEKMVEHMVQLLAKDHAAKIKGKVESDANTSIEKTCVGKISKAQYECVMGAKTFDDAAGCDSK
ncbi:MAG: hypothetical protein ACXWUG_05715 [Polyangiales bacterium]